MAINDFFVWGSGGEKLTPEQVKRQQMQAQALQQAGADFSPAGHWTEALGRGLSGFMGGLQERRANEAENAGISSANEAFNNSGIAELLTGGGAAPQSSGGQVATSYQPSGDEVRDGIISTANSLGIDPVDLATAISYETAGTFDPTKGGPTTKWGQHRGLIQFGEPQAKQYGVDWSNPVASQLGENGAVARYLRDTGVKPGMGLLDVYSAINAGGVGRYNRSDTAAGGAPGTVRDKVEQQMAAHRRKAEALLGGGGQQPVQVASADPNFMPDVSSREIPLTALQPSPVAEALATQPQLPQATAAPASQSNPVSESLLAQNDMALGGALSLDAGAGTAQQAGFPQPQQQQRTAPNMAAILQLANNPYLNDTQRTILGSVLQQQMQANDPLRALQLQAAQQGLTKGELEIAAMQQPKATEYGFQTLGDGTVVRTNKATGEVVPAYEGTPKPTTDVQNYEYATNNPGFVDYQQQLKKAGASSTNVNVGGEGMPGLGKLSSDYGYVLNPETGQPVIDPSSGLPQAAPVPGSPAARQIEEETRAKEAGKRNASDYARTVVQDVGIAKNYLSSLDGLAAADGVVGANYRKTRAGIPGTPEYNMTQFVESALSNVTLDTMNRMRETSAAGATGMGNMSDKQLKVIQGVLGQWDPGLPVKDQQLILNRLSDFYMDVQYGSKAEREEAIRQGRMTKEESDAIDSLYSAVQGNNGGWQEINGVKIRVKQ